MFRFAPAATLAAFWLLISVASAQIAAQSASSGPQKAEPWTPPRGPDGHPKLDGFWTSNTITPLERPKGLGAKEFYTEEEFAELIKREKDRVSVEEEEGRSSKPGTDADVHYDFAQFGLERAQSKLSRKARTSMLVGPVGLIPPMRPEALKRNADIAAKNRGHEFDAAENQTLSARCIVLTPEFIPMLPGAYDNNLQIVQGPEYVTIMNEMNHSVRVVPADGRPHLPPNIRQWRGDSRGHWEGDTLVVDVTNFDPRYSFRGSGDKLHVIERYTLEDPDTILYQFTVEDPTTWDQPWSGELAMTRIAGPVYEFACHEGNYALRNVLHGARVAEQEAAEKQLEK